MQDGLTPAAVGWRVWPLTSFVSRHREAIGAQRAGAAATRKSKDHKRLMELLMDRLFRLEGAVERDSAIDAWLNRQPAELGAIARTWFAQLRDCGDDVLELMHDGCPVVCVEDVPFGYVNVFKAHVNVGFFLGSELEDATGLLEGSGKRMRHVKLKPGSALDSSALIALIQSAYRDVKTRL